MTDTHLLTEALKDADLVYIVAIQGDMISAMLIGDIDACPVCTMADALGGILNQESEDETLPQVLNGFMNLVVDDIEEVNLN